MPDPDADRALEAQFREQGRANRARRQALRLQHRSLFDDLVQILFVVDPVGINFDTNSDEYEPEAATILARLPDAASIDDVSAMVTDEFDRWFGEGLASGDRLDEASRQIWERWQRTTSG